MSFKAKLLQFETRHKVDNTSARKTLVTHLVPGRKIRGGARRRGPLDPETIIFDNFADGQRSENSVTLLMEGGGGARVRRSS